MDALTPLFWAGTLAALAAGATGSFHCALMCGPLACATLPRGVAWRARARTALAWHAGRMAAYLVVGAALGLAGLGLARGLTRWVQPALPWIMAAGLLATAFEVGRRWPAVAGAGLGRRIGAWTTRTPPGARAFALGTATPLLPCGLLWGIFLTAVGTGAPAAGAAVVGAFGLGSAPGLAAVQAGAAFSGRWPRAQRVLARAVPLAAAALLVWRALALPAAGATPAPCH